ncbi:acyl-CoA mutase large subunit family protein [Candidatus Binatus sp.]|jgi:methylmalonyl-CoA mutase N-terminal domain/subunit|uniref:acyl-CoA mutase large subunit family protein n=2 Tax=Candidatus Binatus sp. TaxID=2811406 RepID=UPI003BE4E0E2
MASNQRSEQGDELLRAYFEKLERPSTWSGLPTKPFYSPADASDLDYRRDLNDPGEFPYARGVHADMYRGRLWTRREVCGFGSARDTNQRLRFQISQGVSGLSIIDDNNGSLTIDADHPMATLEAGLQGVSVSSLRDMEDLFEGIPIDKVSVSFDISGLDCIAWMAMYVAAAEKRGIDPAALRGTVQNDTLHFQFCGYGNSCPVDLGLKSSVDIIEFCARRMPRWYTGNANLYDMRENGLDAPQEVAFGLSLASAYIGKAIDRGLNVDDIAPRRAFYCSCHIDFFEEIAKLRSARRIWARLMRDRFGAKDPRSLQFRFGVHTAGVSLYPSQPLNNAIRIAYEALAAVLAGAQSIHTCSYDEPIGLPTETSQTLAIRTQQIIAYETGAAGVADPLGGSWYIESLTNQIEGKAQEIMAEIELQGGMVAAIKSGWVLREIESAALRRQNEIENGEKIVVGTNAFQTERETQTPGGIHESPAGQGEALAASVRELRRGRDQGQVAEALQRLHAQALGGERVNLLPALIEAARAYATLGEMMGTVRIAYGQPYDPMGVLAPPRL